MADNKKYYWLKLKEDFFEDDTISFIEEQENGIIYSNFYLKLCLKSLKNDGKLIRFVGETLIPYDIKSLAKLTNTEIDTVRVAMTLFEEIGLITKLDTGELYLNQINEMIGKETRQAETMRRKRALEKSNNVTIESNNVTQMLPECYIEIEKREKRKDKEIEKDIEIDNKQVLEKSKTTKSPKHKYGEYKNVLLTDDELEKLKSEYPNYEDLITYLDEYIEMKGYKAKSHYLCIKKWVVEAVKRSNVKIENKPVKQNGNIFFDILREEGKLNDKR